MADINNRPLRVFLCHSSADKTAVRDLYNRLSMQQWIDPWLDAEKLLPGQDWDLEIEKAVESAHAVIVCLSNNSITKEGYIQKELRFALDIANEKPEGEVFVIPIRLDDCQVPRRLRTWQYVDYFPKENQDAVFNRLLSSLKLRGEAIIKNDKSLPNINNDYSIHKPLPKLTSSIKTDESTAVISDTLRQKTVDILISLNLHTVNEREAIIYRADLPKNLIAQIDFQGSSLVFWSRLVSLLGDYGLLEDGRHSLEALLDSAKSFVGADIIIVIDELIRNFEKIHKDARQIPQTILKTVTITIDRNIDTFDSYEQEKFISLLSLLIKASPGQIQIVGMDKGSVILTVKMPNESMQTLLSLFLGNADSLSKLRIMDVQIIDDKENPTSNQNILSHRTSQVILFLCADPTNASRLRLGEEVREIREKLQLAKLREEFALEERFSVRPADISQAMLDSNPNIVHFSGHGSSTGALCFENEIGEAHLVEPDALASLFEQFENHVKVVILNACYSETQALAISKHIGYVIGMTRDIGDKAAIAFSIGFYQALGAGKSVQDAYNFGVVQIRLQGIKEHLTPILITRKR